MADTEKPGQYTLLARAKDAGGVLQPDEHDQNYGTSVINLAGTRCRPPARTLFPDCLEDWIVEDNPVRVIDVFVDELDLGGRALS